MVVFPGLPMRASLDRIDLDIAYFVAPRRRALTGEAASGFGWRGVFFDAERDRVSGPNPELASDVT